LPIDPTSIRSSHRSPIAGPTVITSGIGFEASGGGSTPAMRARVITESPALLARERQVFDRYADALAALIAEETGSAPGDAEPRAVANALLGVHRALIDYTRQRVLAGAPASQIARELPAQAKQAFAQLERGLGDYAVKGS
jgi:hypothetical protein